MEYITTYGKYRRKSYYAEGMWISSERGVEEGDTRVIDKVLYYAWNVDRDWPSKSQVYWLPITENFLKGTQPKEKS